MTKTAQKPRRKAPARKAVERKRCMESRPRSARDADDDEEEAGAADEPIDPRFDEAVRIVAETRRCSTSWLQRKLGIGYNRAAKIVEMMEHQGMVGPPNGSKEREICIQPH